MQLTGIASSADEAHRLMNPDDLMDVSETVNCTHAIGRLGDIPFHRHPGFWRMIAENRSKCDEMCLLGKASKLMCTLVIGHEGGLTAEDEGEHLSISQCLTAVASTLAHALFFLFRRNKTKFVPAQHCRDWQDTIKNVLICVALCKVHGVDRWWWFLNTNQRLEQFFGILRSMRNGDMNFDCLDLRNRIADTSLCNWMHSQRPEWNQGARRLNTTIDRKNARSWKGCTLVANVNIPECWKMGQQSALTILKDSLIFENDELNVEKVIKDEPGVDVLCPCRVRVGVLSGDMATHEIVDLGGEVDDEE